MERFRKGERVAYRGRLGTVAADQRRRDGGVLVRLDGCRGVLRLRAARLARPAVDETDPVLHPHLLPGDADIPVGG